MTINWPLAAAFLVVGAVLVLLGVTIGVRRPLAHRHPYLPDILCALSAGLGITLWIAGGMAIGTYLTS